ncbi:MAG: TlpA family protein disulfide reductase [Fibrobacteres bacterium]|nr:TlpA family protein disulfide reductase [Fibrobacterota bacterium]
MRLAFILAFCLASAPAMPSESFPKVDPVFWKLKLKTITDDSVPMASLQGRYLLLNFWGEWCAKCQEELPFLVRQEMKYSGSGLRIIGFLKTANMAKAKKLLKENGADWTQLQLDDQVERIFGIRKFPTNLLISPQGEIVMEGFSNHYQDFKKRLEASGSGSEVKKSEIPAPPK